MLNGQSVIGNYTVDVNPKRGVTGASYLNFENVANAIRISTTTKSGVDLITIKLNQIAVLKFKVLPENKLTLIEAPVSKQWPYLIDQTKAKEHIGKANSFQGDSYQKATELFAELLSSVSRREVGLGEKIIWHRGLVYIGQFIHKDANGEGRLYDYETNQLYISCDKFIKARCQGNGEQYDVTIPTIIYKGEFVNSKREGKGKEWLKDKSYLLGNYVAGNKEGAFVQTFEETKEEYGFTAKGNYKNNKKVGVWHYKFESGREIESVFEAGKLISKTIVKESSTSVSQPSNEHINMAILKTIFRSLETINEDMELLNHIGEAFERSGNIFRNKSAREAKEELKQYLDFITLFWSEAIGDSELELAKALKIAQISQCTHTVKHIEHLQYINRVLYEKMRDLHTRTKTFVENRKKDDDEFNYNYAIESFEPIISQIDIFISTVKKSKQAKYMCRDMEKTNNQTTSQSNSTISSESNNNGHSPQEVVTLFLKALFVNEDKAKAESYISPSFVRKIKAINADVLLNGYASSQYELARQNNNRIVVNLYLLKGSKQLYNELTFVLEKENGQYYIKPNIRDYNRGEYYDSWVDLERVQK